MRAEAIVKLRPKTEQAQLWWIRPLTDQLQIDETKGHLFAGDERAMADHAAELHKATGRQQAARLIEE